MSRDEHLIIAIVPQLEDLRGRVSTRPPNEFNNPEKLDE